MWSKKKDSNTMNVGAPIWAVSRPKSVVSEQFNTIRTNIKFSSFDKELKKIMVTSSNVSEGKSTVAVNIAASFAKQGLRTVLVDTDLRRPTIKATFQVSDNFGLTNFLTSKDFDINQLVRRTTLDNLFIMPSGPIPPNPSELIGSKSMKKIVDILNENFDLVIFDAPPLLAVTDAQILSTEVDGTILVVRDSYTEKNDLKEAVGALQHVNAKIIGTILNDIDYSDDKAYAGYGYTK